MNWKILSQGGGHVYPRIQDLGINGNPVSGCYAVTINYTSRTTNYRMRFAPSIDSTAASLYVTRTSIVPGAWTMVTNGPCAGVADQANVTSQDLAGRKRGRW